MTTNISVDLSPRPSSSPCKHSQLMINVPISLAYGDTVKTHSGFEVEAFAQCSCSTGVRLSKVCV